MRKMGTGEEGGGGEGDRRRHGEGRLREEGLVCGGKVDVQVKEVK